jgi:hypothetical protein
VPKHTLDGPTFSGMTFRPTSNIPGRCRICRAGANLQEKPFGYSACSELFRALLHRCAGSMDGSVAPLAERNEVVVRVGAAKLGGSDVMSNETVIVAADDAFTAVLSASRPHETVAGLRQPRQRHIQCLHLLYAEPRRLWPRRAVIRRKLAGLHQAIDRRPRAPKKSGSASQRHIFRHQRMIRGETGRYNVRRQARPTLSLPALKDRASRGAFR